MKEDKTDTADRDLADSEEISDQEKCTRQPVLIAVRNVKFRSNQQKAGQSIVEIVS